MASWVHEVLCGELRLFLVLLLTTFPDIYSAAKKTKGITDKKEKEKERKSENAENMQKQQLQHLEEPLDASILALLPSEHEWLLLG